MSAEHCDHPNDFGFWTLKTQPGAERTGSTLVHVGSAARYGLTSLLQQEMFVDLSLIEQNARSVFSFATRFAMP